LFSGQVLKMPFSTLKFEFGTILENLDLKIEKKNVFFAYWADAPLSARQPKSAWPASVRARSTLLASLSPVPRPTALRSRAPRGRHAPMTVAPSVRWRLRPSMLAYIAVSTSTGPCSLSFPPTEPAAATAHVPPLPSHPHAPSSELAVSTALAHHQQLHLALSPASSSRSPRSHKLAMVRPLRRALLAGAWLSSPEISAPWAPPLCLTFSLFLARILLASAP
jgi:hypothetical protein